MELSALTASGIPDWALQAWAEAGRTELLPLQETAARRTGLLSGKSLVIGAPTSAGKTFVGEMAAVRAVESGRGAVFLVPTRALAEELYAHLRSTFHQADRRVLIATRDRTAHEDRIKRGDFDFLVTVYEKFRGLLAAQPGILSHVGTVVADELQVVGEPDRGAQADLLLTRLSMVPSIQIVGLTAVAHEVSSLAQWLGAEPLQFGHRPVELREGVVRLADGWFQYQDATTGKSGAERLLGRRASAPVDATPLTPPALPQPDAANHHVHAAAALAAELVGRGESLMVFVPTRGLSRTWAAVFARHLSDVPVEDEAMAARAELRHVLAQTEECSSRRLLDDCVSAGVAFHNADLPHDVRQRLEQAFDAGAIHTLIATATLAQGVNLQCRNVLVVPYTAARPADQPATGGTSAWHLLDRGRFLNMAGRAGRVGSNGEFGRAMVLAADAAEADRLYRRLVAAPADAIQPPALTATLDLLLLDLVRQSQPCASSDIRRVLQATYSARRTAPVSDEDFDQALARLIHWKMVTCCAATGMLESTPAGAAAAAHGVGPGSALWFARVSRSWGLARPAAGPLEESYVDALLLAVAALSPAGAAFPFPLPRQSDGAATPASQWLRMADELGFGMSDELAPPELQLALPAPGRLMPLPESEAVALRKALLCLDYSTGMAAEDLEKNYRVALGAAGQLACHLAYLLLATAAVAEAVGADSFPTARCRALAQRLPDGLPACAAELAGLSGTGLNRPGAMRLVEEGLATPALVAEAPVGVLRRILPADVADRLRAECTRIVQCERKLATTNAAAGAAESTIPPQPPMVERLPSEVPHPTAAERHRVAAPTTSAQRHRGGPRFFAPRSGTVQATDTAEDWISNPSSSTSSCSEPYHAYSAPLAARPASSAAVAVQSAVALMLDRRNPGVVVRHGSAVRLSPLPFRLLALLCDNRGRTVSYDEIRTALWPDAKVEHQQIHFHKNHLLKALNDGTSTPIPILTRTRLGLCLDLSEEELLVR